MTIEKFDPNPVLININKRNLISLKRIIFFLYSVIYLVIYY